MSYKIFLFYYSINLLFFIVIKFCQLPDFKYVTDLRVILSQNLIFNKLYIIYLCLQVTNSNRLELQQYCAVAGCKNLCDNTGQTTNKNILFHKFPNDTEVLNKWLEFCNCSKEFKFTYQNAFICSEHFDKNNYEYRYIAEVKYH